MPYTVAFFGATGGSVNACLAHLLLCNDVDYRAIALVRTGQKLVDSLKRQPGITDAIITRKLSIVQGDALDVASVKKAVLCNGDDDGDEGNKTSLRLVDAIVSGIGAYPIRKPGTLFTFTMENPHITEQAATTLITALREIYSEQLSIQHRSTVNLKKPMITVISGTGVSKLDSGKQDVPIGLRPLYHCFLPVPHADKKNMENVVLEASKCGKKSHNKYENDDDAAFRGVVIVRPTLLTGDGIIAPVNNGSDNKQKKPVRAGTDSDPVLGYSISRSDVGEWIWKNVLLNEDHGERWFGERVSLAY